MRVLLLSTFIIFYFNEKMKDNDLQTWMTLLDLDVPIDIIIQV